MTEWVTPLLLASLLGLLVVANRLLLRRYPPDTDTLIDAVDALLPQTQCAQCNYPGCRPYAAAIVAEQAPLNLCPPGGHAVHEQLQQLMGNTRDEVAPAGLPHSIAVIDESRCIGCALCLAPCPVDAIVGAPTKMHTVITTDCTGCELCVPACPVDCINMQPVAAPVQQRRRKSRPRRSPTVTPMPVAAPRACIGCGRCNPACPLELPAQTLYQLVSQNRLSEAVDCGLMSCIECGLCDQACPSDLALAATFGTARWQQQQALDDAQTRQRFKDRYQAHTVRLHAAEQAAAQRRAERMQRHQEGNQWQ